MQEERFAAAHDHIHSQETHSVALESFRIAGHKLEVEGAFVACTDDGYSLAHIQDQLQLGALASLCSSWCPMHLPDSASSPSFELSVSLFGAKLSQTQ